MTTTGGDENATLLKLVWMWPSSHAELLKPNNIDNICLHRDSLW